jgi:hypothetical protein
MVSVPIPQPISSTFFPRQMPEHHERAGGRPIDRLDSE